MGTAITSGPAGVGYGLGHQGVDSCCVVVMTVHRQSRWLTGRPVPTITSVREGRPRPAIVAMRTAGEYRLSLSLSRIGVVGCR